MAQWDAVTLADDTKQLAAAQAAVAFTSAQYAAACTVTASLAATLNTPWAQFEAQLAATRSNWWASFQQTYLNAVKTSNAQATAYQKTIDTAYLAETQSATAADLAHTQTEAALGVTEATQDANAQRTYAQALATAASDYAKQVAQVEYDYRASGGGSPYAHGQAINTVDAEYSVAWRNATADHEDAVAQAEYDYVDDRGEADKAWTHSRALADEAESRAESNAYLQWETAGAQTSTACSKTEAQTYVAALASLGQRNTTPWAQAEAALAAALASWTTAADDAYLAEVNTDARAENTRELGQAAADVVLADQEATADAAAQLADAATDLADAHAIAAQTRAFFSCNSPDLPTKPDVTERPWNDTTLHTSPTAVDFGSHYGNLQTFQSIAATTPVDTSITATAITTTSTQATADAGTQAAATGASGDTSNAGGAMVTTATTDLSRFPVGEMRKLIADGLATESSDGQYVAVVDVFGTEVQYYLFKIVQPTRAEIDPASMGGVMRARDVADGPLAYRLVKIGNIAAVDDDGMIVGMPGGESAAHLIARFRDGGTRQVDTWEKNLKTQEEIATSNKLVLAVEFGTSMVPGVAGTDYAMKGDWGNATISFLADASWFLTGPAAAVAKAGGALRLARAVSLVGGGIELGVGAVRAGQGLYELGRQDGDTIKGVGYLGEAAMRLLFGTLRVRSAINTKVSTVEVPNETATAGKVLSEIEGTTETIAESASRHRYRIPNRIVADEVDSYITRVTKEFEQAGGHIVSLDTPGPVGTGADGVAQQTLAKINVKTKVITLYAGATKQDLVEELAHFKQAVRDNYWGGSYVPKPVKARWEHQVDQLFTNLGLIW